MNNLNLMGRFVREHEIRYSQTAEPSAVLTNTLAVPRKFKRDETDFVRVKAFGKTAENISKFFGKGNLIAIQGHIQTGSYDNKDGVRIYTVDIIIDSFDFTGEKKQDDSAPAAPAYQDGYEAITEPIDDDELPF